MILEHLSLQNFRSYSKSDFTFSPYTTVIVGPNTSGKTNLLEAIYLLSSGKSFRAERDVEMIRFQEELARVKGKTDDSELEVVLTTQLKKYLVNGVSKRRIDFTDNLMVVIFAPADLEIVVDSPSVRRNFLDESISQVDREYRQALITYSKALRQRNALLDLAREKGVRNERQFTYWDQLLIQAGEVITKRREEFIAFLNSKEKDVFDFAAIYDKSVISKERLLQYKDAEMGAGVTLVGPHRDDFSVFMFNNMRETTHDMKLFGSRGQQRLVVLQLKLLQLIFMEEATGQRPLLLLDDIFSELDDAHIHLVSEIMDRQQTILTTTHKEFIDKKHLKEANVIELEK
ncbi:MAG: DNA replication and repair protein RecF [Candidatus Levybacteria bacterium]|nr:DNA replication and repair protein RecF [Candidatus Levybacteria bacterium]